jgi:hypothetical protein
MARTSDNIDKEFRVLKLTLMQGPFEATKSGEKNRELRQDGTWIRSRLYCARVDDVRAYDYIEYYNSMCFSPKCPMIRLEYSHTFYWDLDVHAGPYTNGFHTVLKGGCWVIWHGKLVYERKL